MSNPENARVALAKAGFIYYPEYKTWIGLIKTGVTAFSEETITAYPWAVIERLGGPNAEKPATAGDLLKAIQERCIRCAWDSIGTTTCSKNDLVTICDEKDCSLWPYREGGK